MKKRTAKMHRKTKETDISIELNLMAMADTRLIQA